MSSLISFFYEYYLLMLGWYAIGFLAVSGLNAKFIAEHMHYNPKENWHMYAVALLGPAVLLLGSQGGIFRYGFAFPGRSAAKALLRTEELFAEYGTLLKQQPDVYRRHPGKTWREVLMFEKVRS